MEGIAVLAGALVVFFPGILALKILEGITDTRRRSEFDKIAIAVGFSLAIYFAYLGVCFWWKLPHIPVRYAPDGIWPVEVDGWGIVAIFLITVAMSFTVGQVLSRGLLSRANIGRWITPKEIGGAPSAWLGAFSNFKDKWVRVYMADGTVIQGPIESYSDDAETPDFIVGGESARKKYGDDALSLVTPNGEREVIRGPGVLITKDSPVSYVVFLDGSSSKD